MCSIYNGNFEHGDEIIICNDGSTDDTADILRVLASKYQEIKVINHSINQGGGAARNTAVKKAFNNLIFCLDADNILAPCSIPSLKSFLFRQRADIAAFQEIRFFKVMQGHAAHSWFFRSGRINTEDALAGHINPCSSGNYLYTKESWETAGGYPQLCGALDAWGLGVRQLFSGMKMVVMENSFYFHRIGIDSYWVRESKRNVSSHYAFEIIRPFLSSLEFSEYLFLRCGQVLRYFLPNFVLRNSIRVSAVAYWFDNLPSRPLKIKLKTLGADGRSTG